MHKVVTSGLFAAFFTVACLSDTPIDRPSADSGTDANSADSAAQDSSLVDQSNCASPKKVCTKGPQSVCTDVSSDDANCGDCNNACPVGATCKTSKCACTDASKTFCPQNGSGICTDLKADSKNCGTCGNVCPNNHCTSGECDRIVFVTSQASSTNINGVTGANTMCQAAATTGKLPGKYAAWIANGTLGPSATFTTKSATPYVLADGTTVFADSYTSLVTTGPKHALDLTELKSPVGNGGPNVMTNVNSGGDGATASFDCNGWTSTDSTNKWFPGDPNSADKTLWTDGANATSCSTTLLYRLYCFQQ